MEKMVVFNQSTAGYLMLRKFVLKGINKSTKNPHMNVFIFNDTKELRKAISEYDSFVEQNRDYLYR